MNIKNLTREELIQLFKDKECNLKRIEADFGLGKNAAGRLLTKMGIDYNKIKSEWLDSLKKAYENNPKLCKYCGNSISYEDRNRKDFCNQSCAASYNNTLRGGKIRKHLTHCLNCGKELSKSAIKYCDNKCRIEFEYKMYIERWKQDLENGVTGKYDISNHIRKYLFEKHNNSCQICGWNKTNPKSGKVPLQVHHIDGNCLNNKEENLQLLCPNCHSLTDTFGNLNDSSSRIYRKQKQNI